MKTLREKAMDYLARREHSRGELKRKLLLKYENEKDINAALDKLEADGLLSDERFARNFVQARAQAGFGPRRIAVELQQRGVSEQVQQMVFIALELNWQSVLQQQWRKRKVHQPLHDRRAYAKQVRYFLSRGFPLEFIKNVLDVN